MPKPSNANNPNRSYSMDNSMRLIVNEFSKRKINKISLKPNNFWKSSEKPSINAFPLSMPAKSIAPNPTIK